MSSRCRRCDHREEQHVVAGWLHCLGTLHIVGAHRVICPCDAFVPPPREPRHDG
jgi:hypothetical protein